MIDERSVSYGRYRVSGRSSYRAHEPGDEFEARLDRNAEARAVDRGDIELIGVFTPSIDPRLLTFPTGWLSGQHPSTTSRKER